MVHFFKLKKRHVLILRFVLHYGIHLLLPGVFAWVFFKNRWKQAWLLMLGTMIIDIDHLLAIPIFDANRCSLGFHPLHTWPFIILYFSFLFIPNIYVRIIGLGLVIHMFADLIDCLFIL
ncbi:MAG: DUF6122 family protein [Patescibacteria group bacterium]